MTKDVEEPKATHTQVNGAGVRILYAEDDERLRGILADFLRRRGFVVVPVEDGRVLVDRFFASPDQYDLILTDNDMPHMTGVAALRRIRSDDHFKDLPVLVLSGRDVRQEVEGAGGTYLEKSCPIPEFEAMLAKMIARDT